jgi:hypothetical protein
VLLSFVQRCDECMATIVTMQARVLLFCLIVPVLVPRTAVLDVFVCVVCRDGNAGTGSVL